MLDTKSSGSPKNSSSEEDNVDLLAEDYKPGNYDVLCGRGTQSFIHIGNRRFRITIAMNLDRYLRFRTRVERTSRVEEILKSVRAAGGRFLKRDKITGMWFDIGDKAAHKKVGHALRDAQTERHRISFSKACRNHPSNKNNNNQISGIDDHGGFLRLVDTLLTPRRPECLSHVAQGTLKLSRTNASSIHPSSLVGIVGAADGLPAPKRVRFSPQVSEYPSNVVETRMDSKPCGSIRTRNVVDCTKTKERAFAAVACRHRSLGPLKKRALRIGLVEMFGPNVTSPLATKRSFA
mmetsp:Transcript_625/g.1469  ORF Transcript_625/g.1469 Transcript_625/m.1469 type:complete len:292 (-) Transcript_625:520-1395(-)|eukprot:CAMPEP_0116846752 /NCGR_PEP_ID=MMETSP0418-20121206/14023_1 /TAXON_ID=1158023 /ORGANISM="Astrosyne radiata, Strain 13vi08-1A" /LENGTH=291 /DNA_ID=CAMNT_0004478061 /DNA_START=137 /DNA_END=1012 /DNA_ORIENTATION=-